MTQLHRARIFVPVLALLLTASACGASEKKEESSLRDKIEVTGDYGEKPTITIDSPLEIPESTAWTTVKGEGAKVGSEATSILGLTLANARTGKTVISTYDEGQEPLEIALSNDVFPSLAKAVTGKAADSRIVVASSSDDAYGDEGAPQLGIEGGDSIVMVADVLSTDPTEVLDGPTGATTSPPATAPTVVEQDGLPTGFDFQGLRKPKKFAAIQLREGTGPEIETPDRIAANYLGQVWDGDKPFEETFSKEPANFSVGLSRVIKCWDQGLAGRKAGARVMLICPPATAYGAAGQGSIPPKATLVFLIDVLGVG